MKLTVDKLGGIGHGEIELSPLTVFIGPNNTNKTWAAYCAYALFQFLSGGDFARGELSPSRTSKAIANHFHMSQELKDQINAVVDRACAYLWPKSSELLGAESDEDSLFAQYSDSFKKVKIKKKFEVSRDDVLPKSEGLISFQLDTDAIALLLGVAPSNVPGATAKLEETRDNFMKAKSVSKVAFGVVTASAMLEIAMYGSTGAFRGGLINETVREGKDQRAAIYEHVLSLALSIVGNVIPFPAERKALVAIYPVLSAEAIDSLMLPLADFVDFLRRVDARATRVVPPRAGFGNEANIVEKAILGGVVGYEDEPGTGTSFRGLQYIPEGHAPVTMQSTASLVRSLTSLDVYLRYFGSPGDMLVIDEPEMNAHPAAQLAIAEIIALLVNRGIRVIITTHSPYIVDHLKNLIEASTVDPEKQDALASEYILKNKGAFLAPENVSVYLFNNGGVSSILDRERREINWETFGNASDLVNNLYGKTLKASRQDNKDAAQQLD